MASKRRNMFYQNKKQETTEIGFSRAMVLLVVFMTEYVGTWQFPLSALHFVLWGIYTPGLRDGTGTFSHEISGSYSLDVKHTKSPLERPNIGLASSSKAGCLLRAGRIGQLLTLPPCNKLEPLKENQEGKTDIRYHLFFVFNFPQFHTYQIKSEKAYRIAIRDLNAKTPQTEIKKDIEAHGHRVRAISNVLHHKTKVPLPLFFVDLEPASNNADIFCIKRIFYSSVRVEEPHKRQDIVQCTRCQQYRHTKGYCNRPPRCVRCGGEHESSTCSKSRDSAATCALCGGDHTANYKGCPAYKKLTTTLKNNTPKTNPPRAALDTYRPIPRPVAAGTPADALPPAPGAAPVGVTEPHVELSKTVNPPKIPIHPNLNKITYAQISTKETSKNSIPTSNTVRIPNPQPASPVTHSLPVPPVTTIPAASSNTAPSVVPVQLASALASFSNQFRALASELMAALTSLSSLLTTLTTVQLSPLPTLTPGRTDWNTFAQSLDSAINLGVSLKTPEDLDGAVQEFTLAVQWAARNSSQPSNPKPMSHSFNLPQHIRLLITYKRRARSKWQRTRYPSDRQHYERLAQELRAELSLFRSDTYNSYIASLCTHNRSLWDSTKRLLRSHSAPSPLRRPDGSWARSDEDKAQLFANHLCSIFQPFPESDPTHTYQVHEFLNSPLPLSLPPSPFNPSDVTYAIQHLPRRKSPGYDLITVDSRPSRNLFSHASSWTHAYPSRIQRTLDLTTHFCSHSTTLRGSPPVACDCGNLIPNSLQTPLIPRQITVASAILPSQFDHTLPPGRTRSVQPANFQSAIYGLSFIPQYILKRSILDTRASNPPTVNASVQHAFLFSFDHAAGIVSCRL
ncbi:hypothetical protein AAG570_011918 [Ranatra chinensis]|uniref:Pre-C2HC domain-containing protein n=1 Tax=Ranatra chinensis TaxID=642074 RepID=A0ABD0YHA9_9HEMI